MKPDLTPTTTSQEIARLLVRTGAVNFRTDPFFTFTSGTTSPVYIDNRQLLGHVTERAATIVQLVAALAEPDAAAFGAIAGTATAGIPWAAWVADRLDLPLLYVRSTAKEWGRERAVEGTAPANSRVAVLEDLAFTGGSLGAAAEQLRRDGFVVDLALTIVSYETPKARRLAQELGLDHRTLTTIDATIEAAVELGSVTSDQASVIGSWLDELRAPAT